MNLYGLTEEERQTYLQKYNHALFRNSMSFLDIVWEINIPHATIVVLEDRANPILNHTQFSYEEFYGDCVMHRIMEADLEVFEAFMSFENLKNRKEEAEFTVHMLASDGAWYLHRIVITPALDDKGELYCVYLGALNIHEEKQREIAQYQNQEQFREALMSNSYFHFDFDVTAGGLIVEDFVARDGSHPITDSTKMELPIPYERWVEAWYELYEPEFDTQQEKNIFTVDYFKRAFERNERILDIEVKQKSQTRKGVMEFMHIFVILLENPINKHIHACIIWRDISEFRSGILENKLNLHRDNEELKKTVSREEQYQRASISGAIMVYNINLTKNLIEEEFYEMVDGKSYPMLQLVGFSAPCRFDSFCEKWCETKVPEDSREAFLKMYNRQYFLDAYARGEYHLEMEFDTVIGRGIPITLRSTVLLVKDEDSGDIIAMVNGKDVTAQRREEHEKREALREAYESANRANAAKTDFLARMSHDIRTPMNAIVGMTAIAKTHLDDKEKVADCLNKITMSSRHLLGLINEVLDMSKIESGKIDLQEEEFVLPELIDNLLIMCKPQIKARGHEFTVSIRGIENENVIGDSQRIQQAFMNLMSNAIKYTPEGGKISLTITEKPTNKPKIGCYEFVFEDNGIGMSREFQEHLFEPFERAKDDRARKEQGTGLGMTITKTIVQMMNGKIQVDSEFNRGTKFTVTIFLKLQENLDEEEYEYLADLPVLVADDDKIACETTCEMLNELGMKGEWVLNGREAVERVVEQHEAEDDFYAVILDWKMPGMDGVETAREIRRQVGDELPIVILSAYDWSDIEQEARAAGVTAFISKPLFKSRMAYMFKELMGHNTNLEQKTSIEMLKEKDYSGCRALLAEDNDLNAEIAQEIFELIGINVERVCDGKEALDRMNEVEDGYYDVIFMDIQMPVMNGYESVRGIRAIDRDYTRTVPILAMSANAFAEDVEEAKASGMNEHIAKPLDFGQLERALRKWMPNAGEKK